MKTRIACLTVCLACCLADVSAEPVGLLDWMRDNRDRHYSNVTHEVLAFYYTWYGRPERHGQWIHWGGEDAAAHEIPESTHFPVRGAYDSHDPELLKVHIADAQANGVTGFIATWWGQNSYDDQAFRLLVDLADQANFKVTIYWETAPGKGEAQIDRAVEDLVYVVQNYGQHTSFLKVNGKPVIFVYGRVMNEVPLASWPAIMSRARAQCGDFLLIADGYKESFARLFDGVHTYNNCAEVSGKSPDQLRRWSGQHYGDAVALARRHGKISCVTVIPGYDDRKIRKPGLNASRQEGQTYRVLWEESMKAEPDWVLITSWNEWHEGSEIEPSWEDGDRYLKLTEKYAPEFCSSEPVVHATAPDPTVNADDARQLQVLFNGRTIGLLPDFGDTAFWLLDAGLPVKELTWSDLVDPNVVNPKTVPILLQAGGEHYIGKVKSSGDVLAALQRYLSQGGFLISMPQQPFPFYYDDTADKPDVIANQIGLPVQQGWEQPAQGARLTFRFNTNALVGLPVSAPFPRTGDLRWRPASQSAVTAGDTYETLASLVDQNGRSLGDGIAFMELHEPPLAGGRTLYVWMRMADAVGRNALMTSVWEFVGKGLSE